MDKQAFFFPSNSFFLPSIHTSIYPSIHHQRSIYYLCARCCAKLVFPLPFSQSLLFNLSFSTPGWAKTFCKRGSLRMKSYLRQLLFQSRT